MLIEVFKTGTHTDSAGKQKYYSPETLDQIVQNYNLRIEQHPNSLAPLVKGHPKSNEPALGWIEKLMRRGNKIVAQIKNIDAELAEEIKNEKYKNFSIALYPDLSLRHIGILGATPPAVKGLNQNGIIYFYNYNENEQNNYEDNNTLHSADNSENYSEYTFPVRSQVVNAQNIQTNTNEINEKDSVSENSIAMKSIINSKEEIIAELNKKLENLNSINEKLLQKFLTQEKETRLNSFNEFARNILFSNNTPLTSSQVPVLVDILELAYQIENNTYSNYSNNDDSISKFNECHNNSEQLMNKLKGFFANMAIHSNTKITDSLNFSENDNMEMLENKELDFSERNVDERKNVLHNSIRKYQQQHNGMSYQDALTQIMQNQ